MNDQTPHDQQPWPGAEQPGEERRGDPPPPPPGGSSRAATGNSWPTAERPAARGGRWDERGDPASPAAPRPPAPGGGQSSVPPAPGSTRPASPGPSHVGHERLAAQQPSAPGVGPPRAGQPAPTGQPSYGGGWSPPVRPQQPPRPATERGSRRRGLVAAVTAVGVVAVGGAGLVGYRLWDEVNGSETPQDAARQAVEGLFAGDLVAAAGTIVPAERRGLDEVARRVVELAGEGGEMAAFEAVEVDLDGLELTPEPLGEEELVAMVELGGEIDVVLDRDQVDGEAVVETLEQLLGPAGDTTFDDLLGQLEDETDRVLSHDDDVVTLDLDRLARTTGFAPYVIAVDDGSGWYLSPSMTLLDLAAFGDEQLAAELGYDRDDVAYDDYRPDVGSGDGGSDPVEAVQVLGEAVGSGDAEDVVEALAPDELAAWRVYMPLFEDELEQEELPWDLDVEVEATADGDVVAVDRLTMDGTWNDTFDGAEYGLQLELEGSCLELTRETFNGDDEVDGCLDDAVSALEDEVADEATATEQEAAGIILDGLRNFERGLELRTVEVGGRHFVSPVATLSGWSLQAMEGLTAEQLETVQEGLESSGGL